MSRTVRPAMIRLCLTCAVCLMGAKWLSPSAAAGGEGCPLGMSERSHWDGDSGSYGGLWADGNYAYQGQFGDAGVHFFDISDPDNPVRVLEWRIPSPNQFASAQEVLAVNGLLYIALESNDQDGVEIVDIRNPLNPVHLTWIRTPEYEDVHNLVYDNGYLYLADSRDPQVAIVDLTTYDPDNPPATILQNKWLIDVGTSFVHDISVQNGRMYASAWNSGVIVYDISGIAIHPPLPLGSAPGMSTHSAWATDDRNWVITAEERNGGPLKLFEVTPNGAVNVTLTLRDSFALPTSEAICAHEPFMVGDRIYTGWYQGGLLIHDLDRVQKRLILRGRYDTFPGAAGGFNGAWGVYPFFGEDRMVVSDLSNGLFVIQAEPLKSLSIDYPQGIVSVIHPADGATLTVALDDSCGTPNLATARVVVSIGAPDGGPIEIPLVDVGGGLLEAELPGAPCGSDYSYYVTVDFQAGGTFFSPPDAPSDQFIAVVQTSTEVLYADDFQSSTGWTTTIGNCPAVNDVGMWEIVDPVGTGAAPENDYSPIGTRCFVTGQGLVGGSDSAADIDGGPFVLISPVINTGGADAFVRYARWFVSNGPDTLVVEISNDGGTSWLPLETVTSTGTQWVLHETLISDVMTPPDTVRLRFTVSDCPNNSLAEAAIDEVSIVIVECEDDSIAPVVVHDAGVTTHPHSGYIDPRRESTNGVDLNQGITSVTMTFSEPVRNTGGAPLDASAFTVESTGPIAPQVTSVDAANNPTIELTLESNLLPESWYTIIADVEDMASNAVTNNGNQGPGVNEPDRVDIGFLPANVDQIGEVNPLDLLKFKQYINGIATPAQGVLNDYVDINRSGNISPLDLLSFKQLVNGITPATQSWISNILGPRP